MRRRPLFWAFLVTVFLILIGERAGWQSSPSPPFERGEEVTLYGTVEEITGKENSQQIRLSEILYISDYIDQRQVLVYENQQTELKIGYRVKVTGEYVPLETASNPGQFDQQAYYEAQGIGMILRKGRVTVVKTEVSVFHQGIHMLRERLNGVLLTIAGEEEAALFSAMLLGEKGELKRDQKELYQSGGISHILAISGLHISLLGVLIYRFLRRLRRGYCLSAALSGSFMVAYGCLVGFGVSAKRAILMFLIYLGAEVLGECYDMLSALSLAGILILLQEPGQLFQCGFQLSFLSVGAVGMVYPTLKGLTKITAVDSFLSGLSVTLVTLPCTLYWFYEFMPYGLLLNLLVIPLVPVVFLSGAAGMIAGNFCLPAGIFFAGPGAGVLKFFNELLRLAEPLPGSRFLAGRPELWKIAVYYVILGAALWWKPGKRAAVFRVLAVGGALAILIFRGPSPACITFLDVGQGDGIFFQTAEGTTCFIDGGSSTVSDVGTYRILPFLKSQGINRLDYLFLTHMDADHVNGAEELLEDQFHGIPVVNLCLADIPEDETSRELIRLARRFGTKLLYVSRGTCFREADFSLECLYPPKGGNGGGTNENSLVLLAEFGGRRVLFTGDLEGVGEEEVLTFGTLSKVDILKVAHHGSKGATTEAFLSETAPGISVISSGEGNRYGHPSPELLERLQAAGTRIFLTQTGGAVRIEFREGKMSVSTFLTPR